MIWLGAPEFQDVMDEHAGLMDSGRRTTRASPRGYGELPIIVLQALFRARPARRRKTNAPAPAGGDKAQGG